MDWGRRLGTSGGLECLSPHVVAGREVGTGRQGAVRVGPEAGRRGLLWGGGTFERRRGREVVQSRVDFVVTSPNSGWTNAGADRLLSDHSSIGGSLVIGEVRRADRREVVDWDRLAATLADEHEGW